MSEQDKSLLDEQALLVRAVYRALPEEEVPAEIERRILANAAAAIQPSNAPRRWLQWSAPLASAAVVILVIAVVMEPQVQREMTAAPVVTAGRQQAAPPPVATVASELDEGPASRRMAEKPNLTPTSKALEDIRPRPSEPRASADPVPLAQAPAAALSKAVPQLREREESVSSAFEPPVIAEERQAREQDQPTMAAAPRTGAADAAGGAFTANDGVVADQARRGSSMSSAPATLAAPPPPPAINRVNPALDVSPALRARLENFLDLQKKTPDAALGATLEQLRRDYPGVDIDAALEALAPVR